MSNKPLINYVTIKSGELLLPPYFYNALDNMLEVTHKQEKWRTEFKYLHCRSISSQTSCIPKDLPFLAYRIMDIRAVLCVVPTIWDRKLLRQFVESVIELSSGDFNTKIKQHFCDVLVDLYASQVIESAIHLPTIKGCVELCSWGIEFQVLQKICTDLTVLPSVDEVLSKRWAQCFPYFHEQYNQGQEVVR